MDFHEMPRYMGQMSDITVLGVVLTVLAAIAAITTSNGCLELKIELKIFNSGSR